MRKLLRKNQHPDLTSNDTPGDGDSSHATLFVPFILLSSHHSLNHRFWLPLAHHIIRLLHWFVRSCIISFVCRFQCYCSGTPVCKEWKDTAPTLLYLSSLSSGRHALLLVFVARCCIAIYSVVRSTVLCWPFPLHSKPLTAQTKRHFVSKRVGLGSFFAHTNALYLLSTFSVVCLQLFTSYSFYWSECFDPPYDQVRGRRATQKRAKVSALILLSFVQWR